MSTARFATTRELDPFARTVNRLMESVLNDGPGARVGPRAYPALNAWEDAHSIVVEAELPGFRIEDIELTLTGGDLTIAGKREPAPTEAGSAFIRRERAAGRFSRTIRIGAELDGEKVSASMTNGVLTITLPKAASARPRRIDVSAG